MRISSRVFFLISVVFFLVFIAGYFTSRYSLQGITLVLFFLSIAIAMNRSVKLQSYAFSFYIFMAVSAAMYFPELFLSVGKFQTSTLIVPILMVIMFGMGTSMNLKDFHGIIRMPKGVLIGLICQFSIMPVIGYTLAKMLNFPAEIASGILLVGCSPSGLASNVMSYISRSNLALSLTLTIIATMLSPLLTPALMELLASEFVPIDFLGMMWSIVKIVILPVLAGLVYNRFFHGRYSFLDRVMPLLSMAGIALVITIITASGRDSLLSIGVLLILAVLIHNSLGYLLGFWLGRISGLDLASARTIAFEVGMQNAGLASGIALEMGRVATMGLAPAVFGPLMNITGSSLAAYWRGKPVSEK